MLLAQDQASKTLALLQRLHAAAAAQGRTGSTPQTDGTIKTFQGTYTVSNGVITQFNVQRAG